MTWPCAHIHMLMVMEDDYGWVINLPYGNITHYPIPDNWFLCPVCGSERPEEKC